MKRKQNYLTEVPMILSTPIYEYDMKQAGLSVIEERKLLSKETIEYQ